MSEERIRKYETIVVTRSDADHGAQRKLHEKLTGLMEESGVRPIRFEYWGKRRLAYQIKKANKGLYFYHTYLSGSSFLSDMNRMLKLSNIVLRYMTVMLDDGVDPETYDFESEQHFDTLPTESDVKKDRDRSRTGWDEEFSSRARTEGSGEEAAPTEDAAPAPTEEAETTTESAEPEGESRPEVETGTTAEPRADKNAEEEE